MILVYRILPKELAAEVFAELDPDIQEDLINCFTDRELKSVINERKCKCLLFRRYDGDDSIWC